MIKEYSETDITWMYEISNCLDFSRKLVLHNFAESKKKVLSKI